MPSTIALQSSSGFGLVLLFAVLLFVVYIGIILWTYSDAQQNSSQPAFLWALVVFFAPFLGLVLYVLLGQDRA